MERTDGNSNAGRRLFTSPQRRLVTGWVVIALVIGLLAYGIFTFARREVVNHQWELLEAIATERTQAITAWSSNRREEAERFQRQTPYVAALARLSRGEPPGPPWEYLLRDINDFLARQHYEAIIFLDPQNHVVRVFGEATPVLGPVEELPPPPSRAVEFQEIVIGNADSREIRILMTAPLWSEGVSVGSLVFVIQPYLEVGPVLSTWPWPESSVEVLVFTPIPEGVLYLTPPRFAPTQVLIAEADPALLTTRALQGERRIAGTDYRGQLAVGVARQIPGTPWYLLAKIDRSELYALVADLALFSGALSLILIGLAGLLALTRFKQLQAQHGAALLHAELDRQALAAHFDYLTKYANDIILLMDQDGHILEANDKAVEVYGYTREQLLRMSFRDLVTEEELEVAATRWAYLKQRKSALFENIHRKMNGEHFTVESSLRVIETEDRVYVQNIMRDISERKRTEARILRLNRLYMTLSRTNEGILRVTHQEELFRELCEIAVHEGEFVASWLMVPTPDRRYLTVLAFAGPQEEQFREVIRPPLTEIDLGQLVSTVAAKTGRSVYVNDYLADPRMAVREWARQHQVGAAAAFPIRVDGRVEAVFGVYTRETNTFDTEVVTLLERMADDVGYAIDNLQKANALRESQERLSLVLQATRDCYWDIDFKKDTVYFSDIARRRFGLPDRVVTVPEAYEFFERRIHPKDLPAARADFFSHLKGKSPRLLSEYRMAMAREHERWIQIRGRVVRRGPNGEPLRMAGVHTDITRQRESEEQLKLWARVFSESRESILVTDHEGTILSVNRAFTDITGYSPDDAVGKPAVFLAADPMDEIEYEKAWETVSTAGYWQGELRGRRKNGELFPFWTATTRIEGKGGQPDRFVAIATDLSEQKATRERIEFLSYYDGLTGLPNRALFRDRLKQSIDHAKLHGRKLAVLFLDIDRFKDVNDSLGPSAGDRLLVELGHRLAAATSPDETVARQGGDEFIVLLTDLGDENRAADVAMELLHEVNRPFAIDGTEIIITASIGIAIYPFDGQDCDTLIRNADTAMYYTKERRKNNFQFFFTDLNLRARHRLSRTTRLRKAIESGDFVLQYQPQADAFDVRPVGVEALIRWPQDEGLLAPAEFIPLAEETGLIVPIGEWVVQEACRQQEKWAADGLGSIVVAINLSALQFREKQVVERLRVLIRQHCNPSAIELELTESALMEDAEESIRTLSALRESGIRLAVDDFGTGYSSLNYLRRFPLDRLKVDRSFVHDLPAEPSDRAITEAIIALAKSLGLTVIAEGVETREELDLLRERACDQIQGNYYAPPLMADELADWWAERRPP